MKKIFLLIFVCSSLVLILENFKLSGSNDDKHGSNSNFTPDPYRYLRPHDRNPIINYAFQDFAPEILKGTNPDLIYNNVDLSNDPSPQNEPSVKISRNNPRYVVGAWRDFRTGINPAVRRVGFSNSSDSGVTWSTSVLLPQLDATHPRASDPSVCVDTAGNFYIATISLDNSDNNGEILVYKSTDGGATFPQCGISNPTSSYFDDKEFICCDMTTGSSLYKNTLYASWTLFTAGGAQDLGIKMIKSTNGGLNWSTNFVSVSNANHIGQGSCPAIGPNGEVYDVWGVGTGSNDIIYFNKSTDGGNTFGTDVVAGQGAAPNIPVGSTFPSMAADISGGSRNGYIYVTWCDSRNGDPDVFLSRSTDGGNSFSTAVRVNNDAIGNGKDQFWPWIAVNNIGNIAILFCDTRNTTSNNIFEAWLARSSDGGVSFTNEVLSTQPSPTNEPNSNVRFGDYINVDFWRNRVVPIWTDERAGGYDMEIYTAVVNLATAIIPVSSNIPADFELKQNYPNPFNPSTKIDFNLPKVNNINLSVFDITGKLISKIFEGEMTAGLHSITWDGSNVASGVYFYKLTTIGFSDTKRMTLVK